MTEQHLREENERLRARVRDLEALLQEPADTLRAIRDGEVDAFVVAEPEGERIYSLRTADVLYRAMVEEMQEGAVVLDESGLILYGNPHFTRMVGVERAAVVGRSIGSFIQSDNRPAFDQMKEKAERAIHTELLLEGSDGEPIPVVASMSRIRLDATEVIGMIVTDLRDQLRRQELLAESSRKDEFLAMLAHELRNPLAPIRNALGLLGMPELTKASLDWSREVIDRQVTQLVRLLDDLLDVQRFTHGVIELKTEASELGALIEAAIEAMRPSVTAKGQTLRIERASEPLPVMADPARWTQIISNLLVNAVKYSPEKAEIHVSWRRDAEKALIRVSDNGIGMSPDLVKRAFEPFVQGDRDLSRSQGGLGLGLTLVKRLVELHGGTVVAASPGVGLGSEFTIHIPLLPEPECFVPRPREIPKRSGSRPRRVLVVDDNEDSAMSLCALLRHVGHETGMARDGVEALGAVEDFKPDVIILDIGLPGMDGYQLAHRFRQMESMGRCRLVALSGYGRSEDHDRTSAAGFSAHLVKPVELGILLNAIEA